MGINGIRTNYGVANKAAAFIRNNPDVGLVFAWMPGVDTSGHATGPESSQVEDAIESVDRALKHFLGDLEENDLLKDTVVVIASDHGMADVTDDDYFLEEKNFFINAKTETGLDPYLVHDAAFELIYFMDETNVSKVEVFAEHLEGEDGIDAVYVNEENDAIGMNHATRGINISVFLNPGRSRNFGGSYQG